MAAPQPESDTATKYYGTTFYFPPSTHAFPPFFAHKSAKIAEIGKKVAKMGYYAAGRPELEPFSNTR